jgi:hypothetical protein
VDITGSTTAGIQEALDLLPTTGGSLILAPGTYKITTTITPARSNYSVAGSGSETVIEDDSGITSFAWFQLGEYSQIQFRNFKAQGGANSSVVFRGVNTDDCIIDNIIFDSVSTAVRLFSNAVGKFADRNQIRHCFMDNFTASASAIDFFGGVRFATVFNNLIFGATDHGINLDGGAPSPTGGDPFGCIISHNRIDLPSNAGVNLDQCNRCHIVGNNITTAGSWGVTDTTDSHDNLVMGNYCDGLNGSGAIKLVGPRSIAVCNNGYGPVTAFDFSGTNVQNIANYDIGAGAAKDGVLHDDLAVAGDVKIGGTPFSSQNNAMLTFGTNASNNKIALYDAAGTFFGFGYQANELRIEVDSFANDAIVLYAGPSTEIWRFKGGYTEGFEISDPGAAPAQKGRLYYKDNGANKTQLIVQFSSGGEIVLATQP